MLKPSSENCNIGTNVIGKTHRKRIGSPVFGDEVWIGSNSVIVGKSILEIMLSPWLKCFRKR